MALTEYEQATIDANAKIAKEVMIANNELINERSKADREATQQNIIMQNKMAAIQLATNVLLENAKTKPVSEREVTSEQIKAFANSLIST